MPLRIVQCLECPIDQHGGVEVLVRELVLGLADKAEVFMASTDTKDSLAVSSVSSRVKGHFAWDANAPYQSQTRRFIEWLRENRINLVHFHLGGTYMWKSRSWSDCPIPTVAQAGFRCVSTNHGAFSIFSCVASYRPWWIKLAGLILFWPAKLRQIAAVEWEATVSKNDLACVQNWFFPIRAKFIQLYHSKLQPGPAITGKKESIILCLGTVGPRKGQNFLVEAFAKIAADFPDWLLVLAGRHADPDTSALVYQLIAQHDLEERVIIKQEVSDSEASQLLSQAAIFAIPSTAEGLGLSLQEALYAGAACIGSNVGGIPDLIEPGRTGLLTRPEDPEDLAQGIGQLIQAPVLRCRLAQAGHQSILDKGMTANLMVENYFRLYSNIFSVS